MNADLPGVDSVEEVLKELERGVESAHEATKGNHKTSKVGIVKQPNVNRIKIIKTYIM